MADEICIHCFVSGKVQGVFYRGNTEKTAISLGLKGWVKNLDDGRVELMACGPEDKIEELKSWLRKGPVAARVDDVTVENVKAQDFEAFSIRRD